MSFVGLRSCLKVEFILFQKCRSEVTNNSLVNLTRCIGSKSKKPIEFPVDYLPFKYQRRPKNCFIANSGDDVKRVIIDETLPKPGFEYSEALKDADENVQKIFSLRTGTKADAYEIKRRQLLEKVQQHPLDFSSPEVRIALKTLLVRKHFEHVIFGEKQRYGRPKVPLLHAIQKRIRMLKHLRRLDCQRFDWVAKELNITYVPPMLGKANRAYNHQVEIREQTEEYCAKLKKDKIASHHKELKRQQELFVKEKEEILAWIAKEEEALGLKTTDKN